MSLPLKAKGEGICFRWRQLTVAEEVAMLPPPAPNAHSVEDQNSSVILPIKPVLEPVTFATVLANDDPFQLSKKHSDLGSTRFGNNLKQQNDEGVVDDRPDSDYLGCWGMDNVLIVNMAKLPSQLEEQFNPVDPSQWLFFPGAQIEVIIVTDFLIILFNIRN